MTAARKSGDAGAQFRLEQAFTDLDTSRDGLLALVDLLETVPFSPAPQQLAAVLGLCTERLSQAYETLYGRLASGDPAAGPNGSVENDEAG